uniref:MATH domain-containing protein n=1 Tax=Globodera pallida TaxID=36090 RepID=A0A183BQU6_GLOPA
MDEQASTSSADSGIFVQQNQQIQSGMAPDKNACKVLRFESATERERLMNREKSPSSRVMPTQLIHPADDDESGGFLGHGWGFEIVQNYNVTANNDQIHAF